jgi:DNA modification methylase
MADGRPAVSLVCGDCRGELARMAPSSVASVVTDPPYGLGFMGLEWDRLGRWSPSAQAWHESWAREALRVLRPGGYLLAMGGTRTFHRLACGLEAAGFEVRDCICWIYASGFPKSAGLAGAGAEWKGWGTALKPAWEPVVVARKPAAERTLAGNVLVHGTGGLNVDGCRIPYLGEGTGSNNWYRKDIYRSARVSAFQGMEHAVRRGPGSGRFPANVLCDNVPDEGPLPGVAVEGRGVSNAAARGLPIFRKTPKTRGIYGRYAMRGTDYPGNPPEKGLGSGILGPYTRFFRLPVEEEGAARLLVVPKPSGRERGKSNRHPTVKPVRLFRHLIRLVTPPGGTVCDPFVGSGTAAVAAMLEGFDFAGIDIEEKYVRVAEARAEDARKAAADSIRVLKRGAGDAG